MKALYVSGGSGVGSGNGGGSGSGNGSVNGSGSGNGSVSGSGSGRKQWLIYGLMGFIQLVFTFRQSGFQSFWLDELSLLGTISSEKSVSDIIWQYLSVDVTNLPLFPLAAALWYRIFPSDDSLMLLLPCLASALSVAVSAHIAELIAGKAAGVLCAFLMAFSPALMTGCCFEFRSYAFMVLNSSLVLFLYLKRHMEFQQGGSKGRITAIAFSVCGFLLLMTHYFGALFMAGLGFIDLMLVVRINRKSSWLIPYAFCAAPFCVWFALMLAFKEKSLTSFWPKPPAVTAVTGLIRHLLSDSDPLYMVFLAAAALLLYKTIRAFSEHVKVRIPDWYRWLLLWQIVFITGGVFVYSRFINPSGGIFVGRYFLVLLSSTLIFASAGAEDLLMLLFGEEEGERRKAVWVIVFTILFIYCAPRIINDVRADSTGSPEPFREAAQWLREEAGEDIYSSKSAVVCSVNPRAALGFTDYYIRRGGREKEVEWISLQDEEKNLPESLEEYDTLYVVYIHRALEDLDSSITGYIEDNFEITAENEELKAFVAVRK